MNERGPSNGALLCLGMLHGLEPRGRETEEMHEHFPASVRGCKAPEAADSRSEYASHVARSRNVQASSNGGFFCLSAPRRTPSTVGLITIQRNIAGIRACQACSRYHCPIRAISISSFLHPTSHEENHEFIAGDRARIQAARLRPSRQRPQPQHPHARSAEKGPVRYQSLRTALHDRRHRHPSRSRHLPWHDRLGPRRQPRGNFNRHGPNASRHHRRAEHRGHGCQLGGPHRVRPFPPQESPPSRRALVVSAACNHLRTASLQRDAVRHWNQSHLGHHPVLHSARTLHHDRPVASRRAHAPAPSARPYRSRSGQRGHARARPRRQGLHSAQLLQFVLGLHGVLRPWTHHRGHLSHGCG